MARCQSCGKLCSLEMQEPEENNIEFDAGSGEVSVDIRIVRTSGCCGDEVKEYTFDSSATLDVDDEIKKKHGEGEKKGHEWTVETTSLEATERSEGKGRGTRSFFGFKLEAEVKCECGESIGTVTIEDDVQASSMDEMN